MQKHICMVVCLLCGIAGKYWATSADVTVGPMANKGLADVPALIQALKDAEMGTRWNAALLLGEIGDASALPALIECAEKDDNTRVRRRAIEALGKLGDQSARLALTEALNDSDRFVRRDAVRALGALGDKSVVPVLITLLGDPEGFVRRDAARALGDIGYASAIPDLLMLSKESAETYSMDVPLTPEEMSPAAREACFALGKLGGDTAVPALAEVLKHTTAEVRIRAALALGQKGTAATPLLAEVVADENRDLRLAAIEGLKTIGGTSAAAGLVAALEVDDYLTQQAAVNALGEVGDETVIPALQSAQTVARESDGRYKNRLVNSINTVIKHIEKSKE